MFKFCIFALGCLFCCGVTAQLRTNFKINRLERCNANKGSIKLRYLNITTKPTGQYLSCDMMSDIPLDDNLGSVCFIDFAVDGKTFVPLFMVRENNVCKAANNYLGQFWYDLERSAQITPGVCPILAGHYHVHDHLLDYSKISLQTFPFGTLKITFYIVHNKNPGVVIFCLLVELKNIYN